MSAAPTGWLAWVGCALSLALSLVVGCVDPQSRYDDFLERSADQRGRDSGRPAPTPGERFDFSGQYLASLVTTLAPGVPILFACDVEVGEDLESVELTFQPLATDTDAMPREPVGASFGSGPVPYREDGSFVAELGEVTVPGRANPISGSDIVATVTVEASVREMEGELPMLFCGDVRGMVSVPLELDLAGSSMFGVATDDLGAVEPLVSCP